MIPLRPARLSRTFAAAAGESAAMNCSASSRQSRAAGVQTTLASRQPLPTKLRSDNIVGDQPAGIHVGKPGLDLLNSRRMFPAMTRPPNGLAFSGGAQALQWLVRQRLECRFSNRPRSVR